MKRARQHLLLILSTFASAQCGHYRWVGAGAWSTGTTLSLMPPSEASPLGMAADIARSMGDVLGAAGVALSATESAADYRLTTTVSVQNRPRLGAQGVQLFELEGRLSGTVRDRSGRTVQKQSVSASDAYFPTDSLFAAQPLVTETSRRTALRRLAEALGRKLAESVLNAPLPATESPQ